MEPKTVGQKKDNVVVFLPKFTRGNGGRKTEDGNMVWFMVLAPDANVGVCKRRKRGRREKKAGVGEKSNKRKLNSEQEKYMETTT